MPDRFPVALVAGLTLPLAGGCHAKFKKAAPNLGEVRSQTLVTTGPHVQLGMMHDDSLVAGVVNIVQAAKTYPVADRLAEAVEIEGVNEAFTSGLADSLGAGPPFAYTNDEGAPLLQVEVLSYGLQVPALGKPGVFTYDLRAKIYQPDGEQVYKTRLSCATGVGTPDAGAEWFLAINNIQQLEEMTDSEVQQAFEWAGKACGAALVEKMRRHAS